MSLAYLVRFVVSPRQYELVHNRIKLRALPTPHEVYKSEAQSNERQLLVRQNARLLLRAYVAGQLFNLMLRLRKSPTRVPAERVASAVALLAAVFRAVSLALKRSRFSAFGPFVAGAVAAPAFALLPESVRPFLALYTAAKAAEYLYNYLDDHAYLEWKPRWLGSWLLFPMAMSQLFYTFVVQPEHCPRSFRLFMTTLSGSYLPAKPVGFPASQHWPSETEMLAGVSEIANLKFPAFKSPLVFRNQHWSSTLAPIFSVLEYAHPGNKTMTGALLHPTQSSEVAAFAETVGANFAQTTRYIFPLYMLLSLVRNRTLGFADVLGGVSNTLRTSTSIAMAAASAWAGIGLSQRMLGTRTLASTRFRVIGFMSGLWAFIDQVNGRARNFYLFRLAVLSQYNILKSSNRRMLPQGDVALFAVSLATISWLVSRYPAAVSSGTVRKTLNWMQHGDGGDPSPLREPSSEPGEPEPAELR